YAAVIPRFFAACRAGEAPLLFGDGSQSRDFTFVEDVVQANLLAASATTLGAIAVNIGAGARTTIKELAESIRRLCGSNAAPRSVDPRPGDVLHSLAATERAERAIGFVARVPLAEGLARTHAAG